MDVISADDPTATAMVDAIRTGSADDLAGLLDADPRLARTGIRDREGVVRTPLHVLADWPGDRPEGAAKVAVLVGAGADVDARLVGPNVETALHWAASCDDVGVLDALIDAGADIEAEGGVIAGGTPLVDAVAFGQWRAARRLVERGAQTPLPEAAALGLAERVEEICAPEDPPATLIDQAFWYACHGDQPGVAAYLAERGADIDWVSPWDGLTPLDAARRTKPDGETVAWLLDRGARSASEL
jgi:ankyrin repeat protein